MTDDRIGRLISAQIAREQGSARVAAFSPEMEASRARQLSEISKRYGLSPPMVDAQFDTLKQQDRADRAEKAFEQAPALRQTIAERPDTARMIPTKDFDGFGTLSSIIGNTMLGGVPAGIVSAARAIFSRPDEAAKAGTYLGHRGTAGALRMMAAVPQVVNSVTSELFTTNRADLAELYKKDRAGFERQLASSPRILEQMAEHLNAQADKVIKATPKEASEQYDDLKYLTADMGNSALTSPIRIIGDVLESLPTTAAMLATVMATRGANARGRARAEAAGITDEAEIMAAGIKEAGRTAAVVGATTEGTVSGALAKLEKTAEILDPENDKNFKNSPVYKELIAAGFDPVVAKSYVASQAGNQAGLAAGLGVGLTNFAGGPILGRIIGEGGSLLGRTVKGFFSEATQEGIQSPLEQLGNNIAERTYMDPTQSLLEGTGEAALAGFVLGGVMGGTMTAAFGRQVREIDETAADINEAVLNHSVLEDAMAAAAGIDLRTNAPGVFAELMERTSTRVSHVYIPIETIDAALADETIPDEEKEALTFYQNQFDDARVSVSGDVVVPIGEALTNFPDTKFWQTYGQDTRVVAGGVSMKEATAQRDEMLRRVNEIGNAAYDATEAEAPNLEAKLKVFSEVRAAMVAAGRGDKEAQAVGTIWASRAEALATPRYGFASIEEAWAAIKTQISDGQTAAPPAAPTIAEELGEAIRGVPEQQALAEAEAGVTDVVRTKVAGFKSRLDADKWINGNSKKGVSEQREKQAKLLRPDLFGGSQTFQQSVSLRDGRETLKKFGLDPNGRYNTREVAAALEARQRAKWGMISRDDRSPEAATKIAKWMVEEVLFEMQHPEQSGVGWYSEKFQRAVDVFAAEFEELATDQDARDLLTALIAITSDGQKVVPNFAQAIDLYANFRKTGKFTTDRGHQRQESIDNNIAKIQQMYDEGNSAQMREDLLKEDTVSNLKKRAKEMGVQFSTAYQAHIKLPLAAVVFGPKLGAFYANLMGAHGYLTMDRWWSRTFNRYRGTLLQSPTAQGLARFKELVTADQSLNEPAEMMSDDRALTLLKPYRDSYAAKDYKNGTEIEKAANTLYKAAFENLEDQPFTAKDRTFMLETVNKAHQMLQKKGAGMSVADIQAVLWYYEKRLYGELGAGKTADVSYEEAARIVIANRRGQPGGSAAPAELDAGSSPTAIRVGEEDFATGGIPEDENGFPLEDGLVSSQGDGNLDPTTLYQFGGLKGASELVARHGSDLMPRIAKAIEMTKAGAHQDDIWAQTGWRQAEDGKWRFEIDDSVASLKGPLEMSPILAADTAVAGIDYLETDPRLRDTEANTLTIVKNLEDVLDHPELFKAYPHLRKIKIVVEDRPLNKKGWFNPRGWIGINGNMTPAQQQSTLHHEIQHAIQIHEGFAGGASPSRKHLEELGLGAEVDDLIAKYNALVAKEAAKQDNGWTSAGPALDYTPEQVEAAAVFKVYQRVLGEMEARVVQERQHMSAAARLDYTPGESFDFMMGEEGTVLIPQIANTLDQSLRQESSSGPTVTNGQATLRPGDATSLIELFRTADFSTMIHETSHAFLHQEFVLAQREGASEELKADVEKLKAWMTKNGGSFDANGLPDRASHELFARTGERYFREGKAPTAELKGVFKQYKDWLTDVYEKIKDLLRYGPAPINEEIRQIFDRMIATDQAIQDFKQGPMSQAELGMSDAEYAAYVKAVEDTHDLAHDKLLERMMKGIRDREKGRYRAQRQNVRDEVLERVNSQPRFVALHLLRTGRWLNDPTREEAPVKINTGWLFDNFGEDIVGQLPVGALQPLHRGDGMDGDLVAEMAGFASGDEMIKALVALKQEQDALEATTGTRKRLRDFIVDQETDRIMGERHGDAALSEDQIREEAIAALNSDQQGEIHAAELRQLQKKYKDQNVITPYLLLREWARRKVNEGTVKDASSKATLQRYTRNYAKATKLLEQALLAKDGKEAIRQKQAQMVNHALLTEAKRMQDQVNTILKRMKRYARTKALASIDQDYMDRIHELIEAYGFRDPSQVVADLSDFREWAAGSTAEGFEIIVHEGFDQDRGEYEKATVAKLLELDDMVRSVAAQGKARQKMLTAVGEQAFQEMIDEARARILALPPRKLPESLIDEDESTVRRLASDLIKVENGADIMDGTSDGTGPLNRVLIRPATEAANKYARIREEVLAPIAALLNRMNRKQRRRLAAKVTISELTWNKALDPTDPRKGTVTVTRMQLLGMIANTGNQSNLAKMVGGEGWGDPESATDLERIRGILTSDKYVSKEDMDLVQAMWDGVDKLWPYIAETERALTGVVPERVVPREFNAFGNTYRGGYWPVVFDSTRSAMGRSIADQTDDVMGGAHNGVGTPKGHTITRTGAMAPLDYDLKVVLNRHLTKVVSRIAYGPWVRDAMRFINHPGIRGAIEQRLGPEYFQQLKPWLRDQIPSNRGDEAAATWWEKYILGGTRRNMSIAVLGVSYTTGVAQTLGLGYAAGILGDGNVKEGGKWIAVGIDKALVLNKYSGMRTGDENEGVLAFVFARSEEMQRRCQEMTREIVEAFERLGDKPSTYRKAQAMAFWHIGYIDLNMVAIPAWLGGYEKAKAQGMDEADAAAYADKVVRKSQGSGRNKDLSRIQRGSPGAKFITMFYTPASVFFNYQWEGMQHLKAMNNAEWGQKRKHFYKAAAPTFWFLAVSTIANAMREGDWPEDDDKDGLGAMDIGEWAMRNMAFELFYGVPFARDAANAGERILRGEYSEFGSTPISAVSEAVIKGVKVPYDVWWKDEDLEGKDIKAVGNAFGFLFGLPSNQPGKTVGFLYDVYGAETVEPEGFGDWYEGITSGKIKETEGAQ